MKSVRRLLPTTEELSAAASEGRLIDRVESYLPDSLYRRKPAAVTANGHDASAKSRRPGKRVIVQKS